jgi:hypothetical protein
MSIPRLANKWELSTSSLDEDISFDIPNEMDTESIFWKLDLPKPYSAAERELQDLENEIETTEKILDQIPIEIERAGNRRSKVSSGDLSFQSQQITDAEAELFALVNDLNPTEAGLSFDLSDQSRVNWQKAAQELEDSFHRIKMILTRFAVVETRIQGEFIGQTVVGWSGRTDSSWQSPGSMDTYHLHKRSLQAALASRYLLLNMLVISAQSASRLAALLAIPGGAVLALPAVWKYVSRILNELEKYQTKTRQGVN